MIIMDKLRMAHASTHGARKPPGPIKKKLKVHLNKPDRLVSIKCILDVFHLGKIENQSRNYISIPLRDLIREKGKLFILFKFS